ncbi:MAG: glycoside hydrolase family 1 protein [Minicystis sp.]
MTTPPIRPNLVERPLEAVPGADLARPERAEQEHVPALRVRGQGAQRPQRRRVRPLQVVEEEHERSLLGGHGADEGLERGVEAVLGLHRARRRDLRWIPEDLAELRDQLGQHAPIRGHGLADPPEGLRPALLGLGGERPREGAERLDHRRIRHVRRAQVELARSEPAALRGDGVPHRLDEGGLADAGVARQEHQLGPAGRTPGEGVMEDGKLVLAAVQALGQRKLPGEIELTQLERRDDTGGIPLPLCLAEIGGQGRGALVSPLRHLGEQLLHEVGEHLRDASIHDRRGHRDSRQVPVHQLEQVGRAERGRAGEHRVERRPEGVEVCAPIDEAAHSPGLLRRDPRELAGLEIQRACHARERGSMDEVHQRDLPPWVEDHVGRRDRPMDDALRVDARADVRELDGDAEEDVDGQRARAQPVREILGPGVLQEERRRALRPLPPERPRDPGDGELREDGALGVQQLGCPRRPRPVAHGLAHDGLARGGLPPEHEVPVPVNDGRCPRDHGPHHLYLARDAPPVKATEWRASVSGARHGRGLLAASGAAYRDRRRMPLSSIINHLLTRIRRAFSGAPASPPYPRSFLWGAAFSAHQTEGRAGGGENGDWYRFEHETKDGKPTIAGGDTADRATDFWNRYDEDYQEAKAIGLGTLRTSIAWEKVNPAPGVFSTEAIDHYRRIVGTMRDRGLRPMIALHHFTHPRWFHERGGWTSNEAPGLFLEYATRVVDGLGDLCDLWITFNEPMILVEMGYLKGIVPPLSSSLPAAYEAAYQLARAHRKVAAMIHRRQGISPGARAADGSLRGVGIAHAIAVHDPFDPDNPKDREAAATLADLASWSFLRGLVGDHLAFKMPKEVPGAVSFRRAFPVNDVPAESGPVIDWIGVNYYMRWRIKYDARSAIRADFEAPPGPRGDNGWAIAPEGLERVLRDTAALLSGVPLVVTENGVADGKDDRRPAFLRDHLAALDRAIHGSALGPALDIRGYYHWALTDNFEWLEGYQKRFGLVAIDYDRDLARVPRPSARVYAEEIRRRMPPR